MNKLDDLTIGEVKQIQRLFPNPAAALECALGSVEIPAPLSESMLGEYVIVRTRNEGLNAGFLVQADETGVVLDRARRIWYHKPADSSVAWYEGVAKSGLHKDSKVSCESKKVIVEDYSLTLCSDAAKKSIMEHASHES